jgi:hypothetical protein
MAVSPRPAGVSRGFRAVLLWWRLSSGFRARTFVLAAGARAVHFPPAMKYLVVILLLAQSALGAGLKWEATTRHLEARPGDRSVRAEFPYRNSGKTTIRIESARGACVCCTSAKATKNLLAAGESGVVVVTVGLEGKRFPMVKPVTVKTDDGQSTVLVVEVVKAKP